MLHKITTHFTEHRRLKSHVLSNERNVVFDDALALFGGNWNNDLNVGSRNVNLNNASGNSNSNIGASHCGIDTGKPLREI